MSSFFGLILVAVLIALDLPKLSASQNGVAIFFYFNDNDIVIIMIVWTIALLKTFSSKVAFLDIKGSGIHDRIENKVTRPE